MIFEIADDNLTLKLTSEFISELQELLVKERQLHEEASAYYESLEKRLNENHEAFNRWEAKLNEELKSQNQSRA